MNLQELEQKIISIEADKTLDNVANILSGVAHLKQDISYVKSQLDKLG